MNALNTSSRPDHSDQQGASLIVAILSLLLTTLLGIALMSIGLTSRTIASNDRQTTEAFFIAEAGMAHGLRLIENLGKPNFTKILKNGDDNNPWDNLANGDQLPAIVDQIPALGLSLAGVEGSYRVSVIDDDDGDSNPLADSNGRLLVKAVGRGADGSTATLEAVYGAVIMPGLLVDGRLRINGNPRIIGVGGVVHSNGTMDFDGSPCASQYFGSASNIIDQEKALTGAGCNGNDVRPSSPPINVPDYNPANWATDPIIPDPDFIFRSDGKVLKKIGVVSGTANNSGVTYNNQIAGYVLVGAACTGSSTCSGDFSETLGSMGEVKWSFDGGTDKKEWKLGGDGIHGGRTYYFQGCNLGISGNPGTSSSPAVVTLMADGYIDMSGNPFLTPKDANVQMMAGNDLGIGGNPSGSEINFRGLHYARHQIKFNGNPTISGQVIAKSLTDSKFPAPNGINLVPLTVGGFMEISGNPIINYDGGGVATALRIMSWREVRN